MSIQSGFGDFFVEIVQYKNWRSALIYDDMGNSSVTVRREYD